MGDLTRQLTLAHGPAWANPITLAPLTNLQSHADGTLSDDEYHWLVRRAEGGFGLTMTCAAYVDEGGQAWPGQLGVSDDRHLPGLTRLADGIRAAGSVSAVQLHHGGRRADPHLTGRPNVSAWADPDRDTRALTTGEVQAQVEAFVAAAVRADAAGFDAVQVHGAHGYLVGQFLDGRHNLREDGYGGSLEDRSRMLVEILTGIRSRTRADFQVGLRLTPERNGILLDEARAVAERVMTEGLVDFLDMSLWDVRKAPAEPEHPGLLIDHFADLRRGGARLGVAGAITSSADVAWCLERGADFVAVGTGAIIHHDFAARAVADPSFVAVAQPVTRAHLAAESVGPTFVDYLATNWDDFVSD
ncbi:MAG: NADH:flavin oxidoreductase [Actinobacteria bacterium]|uniref:Unannotated protein n=1 Tax=freshwater metagenome TaxID=449393 RepID=A0A6J6PF22_9ZZZZ|nr:NADH:flavin oxidoreductase [Actinomycetota bacterium]